MPLTFFTGDLFETPADIRINTVNCVGVMGAGLALAFKTRYPSMFKAYQKECRAGNIQPGHLHVWQESNGEQIINFPTKRHWRQPSRYEDLEAGLVALREHLESRGKTRVVLPALGAGNGGLDWSRVKQMIVKHLKDLEADILVFTPLDSYQSGRDVDQAQLRTAGITTISPESPNYPAALRGRSTATLYVKGDIARLDQQLLAILPSPKPDKREIEVAKICIEQLTRPGITLLTGYGPDLERPFIRVALKKHLDVVIYIADGINHFRVRKDLQDLWDDTRITIISFVEPMKSWNKNLHSQAINTALFLAKTVLITDPNPEWLPSLAHTQGHAVLPKVFYLSYQSQSSDIQKSFHWVNGRKIECTDLNDMLDLEPIISLFQETHNVKPDTTVSREQDTTGSAEISTAGQQQLAKGQVKPEEALKAEQMSIPGMDVPANDTPSLGKKAKRTKTAAT